MNRPTRQEVSANIAAVSGLLDKAASQSREENAQKRERPCTRCSGIRESEESAGRPAPPVKEAISWVSNGLVYYGALCQDCGDIEWSEKFNGHWERLGGNSGKITDENRRIMYAKIDRHTASGRRYIGTVRQGAPAPVPQKAPAYQHTPQCTCLECRSRAVAEAFWGRVTP